MAEIDTECSRICWFTPQMPRDSHRPGDHRSGGPVRVPSPASLMAKGRKAERSQPLPVPPTLEHPALLPGPEPHLNPCH